MRRFPFANEPELPVDGDVRLVAKERDADVRCGDRSVILPFCFREFQCPARMAILMRQLYRLVLPVLWDPSLPKTGFFSVRIALLWSSGNPPIKRVAFG